MRMQDQRRGQEDSRSMGHLCRFPKQREERKRRHIQEQADDLEDGMQLDYVTLEHSFQQQHLQQLVGGATDRRRQ